MSVPLGRGVVVFRGSGEGSASEGKKGSIVVNRVAADSLRRVVGIEEAFPLRGGGARP